MHTVRTKNVIKIQTYKITLLLRTLLFTSGFYFLYTVQQNVWYVIALSPAKNAEIPSIT